MDVMVDAQPRIAAPEMSFWYRTFRSTIKATPETADECLDTILRNARRCAAVVRSVLQVSRREPAVRETVQVNDIVRRAVGAASDVAAERHATVELLLEADLPTIEAAPLELEQAIANLVRNAAEAGDGIQIRVGTRSDPGAVRIEVSDDGRGIAPALHEGVFEPFFTTRQDEGGTGLGLSLVRAVVHAHGGRVELGPGRAEGTRAEVILPRRADGE